MAPLVISTLGSHFSTGYAQGSLMPPGPPAPTMLTLNQIEPRTPISSLPYTISVPGSYYVTTNLTGLPGSAGITIATGNVTLDLKGFALQGLATSLDGIDINASCINVTVRDGNLSGWGGFGVYSPASNVTLESLSISGTYAGIFLTGSGVVSKCNCKDNSQNGIYVNSGKVTSCLAPNNGGGGINLSSGTVLDCTCNGDAGYGIIANSGTVSSCTCNNDTGYGITTVSGTVSACTVNNDYNGIYISSSGSASDCVADNNLTNGIYAVSGTVSGCTANNNKNNGIEINDPGTVIGCTADGNLSSGILAGNITAVGNNNSNVGYCTIVDCNACGNANGIYADVNTTISGCNASTNDGGGIYCIGSSCTSIKDCTTSGNYYDGIAVLNGSSIIGCTANNNWGFGSSGILVPVGCTVKDCTANGNDEDGINATSNCQIVGNTCSMNKMYGIELSNIQNRVDENTVGFNTSFGIYPDFTDAGNVITRNVSPGAGYGNLGGNNDYAPIQTPNTATSPWANF